MEHWNDLKTRWDQTPAPEMDSSTISWWIYRGISFLEREGFSVEIHADLPENVAGRISFSLKRIQLNEPSAAHALCVLAHEYGHWLDYVRRSHLEPSNDSREKMAYCFGWCFLKLIGAPVSKQLWRDHHEVFFSQRGNHEKDI